MGQGTEAVSAKRELGFASKTESARGSKSAQLGVLTGGARLGMAAGAVNGGFQNNTRDVGVGEGAAMTRELWRPPTPHLNVTQQLPDFLVLCRTISSDNLCLQLV